MMRKREKIAMSQQRITAGAEVPRGNYRCNACAKEVHLREEQNKLPQCSACGGFSWRISRMIRQHGSMEWSRRGGDRD